MLNLGIRQIDFVTIYTQNLTAAREFYVEQLEFPVIREAHGHFFQIDVAGVPICVDLNTTRHCHNNIGIVVNDLAATETALRERNLTVEPHERWLSVRDPDGNELIFLVRDPRC